jgi:hypothetical protein
MKFCEDVTRSSIGWLHGRERSLVLNWICRILQKNVTVRENEHRDSILGSEREINQQRYVL